MKRERSIRGIERGGSEPIVFMRVFGLSYRYVELIQ